MWSHGWNVLGLGMLLQALTIGLFLYSFTFWVAPWTEEFGVTRTEVMLGATVYNWLMGLAGPFLGQALDAWPARRVALIGLGALIAGLLVVSVASAFWQILAAYSVLMPIAAAFAGPLAAQTLAVRWFPERRGFALGLAVLGTNLGGVVLPPVVTGLLAAVGWRSAHHALAAGAAALIPLAWWVLSRDPPASRTSAPAAEGSPASVSMRDILATPAFWALLAMFTPMYFIATGFQYNIAPLAGDAGIDAARAARIVSFMSLVMLAGKVGFGWLMDRVDHRLVFAAAAGGMSATVLALGWAPAAALPAAIVLVGLFNGSILPVKGAMVAGWFGASHYGRAVGLMSPVLMSSSLASPLVAWLRESSGSYALPFAALAIAVLPGIGIAFWQGKRRA